MNTIPSSESSCKESNISDNKRLEQAIDFVRGNFFPRWDKGRSWAVQITKDLPSHGRCFSETKSIHIQHMPKDDNELNCLLIHETCHAVTSGGHAKRWQGRMFKSAQRAEQIGLKKLAMMICDEIEGYIHRVLNFSASYVYGQIADFVVESPDASYGQIIRAVAQDSGLYQHELEEKFVRCKRVYEKAKRNGALFSPKR